METRSCTLCSRDLPLSSFGWRAGRNGTQYRRHQCSTCLHRRWKESKEGARERIRTNAKLYKAKYQSSQIDLKRRLLEAIGQPVCSRCGFSDLRALSFHHREPSEKSFLISYGFTHNYAYETLLVEAKKCDALCENCHGLAHYKGTSKAAKIALANKTQLMKDIGQEQCRDCGCSNPICLAFHHRDPICKSFKLSGRFGHTLQYQKLLDEAKKCDILCRNCHLIYHASEEATASGEEGSQVSVA